MSNLRGYDGVVAVHDWVRWRGIPEQAPAADAIALQIAAPGKRPLI